MKQYIKRNAPLLGILAVTVIISMIMIAGRWQAENKNKTYDTVLDYTELELLAEQSDNDISWWLDEFHAMGINQVGLTEENLTTLSENPALDVTADIMEKVMSSPDWRDDYPAAFLSRIIRFGFDRFDVLVEARGPEISSFIVNALTQRFPSDSFFSYEENNTTYIFIDATITDALYGGRGSYTTTKNGAFIAREELLSSKVMYVSLGLLPEKVEIIQSAGMEIIPRILCYNGHNDTKFAMAAVADLERQGIVPEYMVAGGEAFIGADDNIEFVRDYMQRNNITLGLIETSVQRENLKQTGLEELAAASGYNAVRVFSVWDYVQNRYQYYGYEGAEEVENCLYRAIVERNVRILYFKPVKANNDNHIYITNIQVYRDLFESLNDRLATHGITPGRASVTENYQIPSLALLIMGLGAGIGGVLLPDTFLPMRRKWTLLLAGIAAVCVAGAWRVLPNSFRLVASFANAVVFACLAAAFFLAAAKRTGEKLDKDSGLLKILSRSVVILLLAVAISLAGAMMTAAPLSSAPFMLEIGIFRGVKAAQLIPLAYFCVLFLSYYGLFEKNRKYNHLALSDIATALHWNIPVWAILAAAVLGLAGYYYLARTGHETSVTIPAVEMAFRNELEFLFLARPRTKEFLVAFPCIMLTVYSAVRRLPLWTALFGLAGTIGLTSVCNTFMHIRTPLYLGFVRTGFSVLLGILIGTLYILCFDLLCRLAVKFKKNYSKAE